MGRHGVPHADEAARLLSSGLLVKFRGPPSRSGALQLAPQYCNTADHLASEHCFSLTAWYLASPQQSVNPHSQGGGWADVPTSQTFLHLPSHFAPSL